MSTIEYPYAEAAQCLEEAAASLEDAVYHLNKIHADEVDDFAVSIVNIMQMLEDRPPWFEARVAASHADRIRNGM